MSVVSNDQILCALNKIVDDHCLRVMFVGEFVLPYELVNIIIQHLYPTITISTYDNCMIAVCDGMVYYNNTDCLKFKICQCKSQLAHQIDTECRHTYVPRCSLSLFNMRNCMHIRSFAITDVICIHYILVNSNVYLHTIYSNINTHKFIKCEHKLIANKIINMMRNRHKLTMLQF
jgi:hypothetical protein